MKLLHFLLHICSKNCFDWCEQNIWVTSTKFWGNADVGSWIVNIQQICWWLQWLTQDSFLTFHRISCIFTNNPNMHTCRLAGNDVAEKRWAPKFAAGQVCIWMYSGCNSALQFPTEKNSPPCLFTSNFANKYKCAHTDICRKKKFCREFGPRIARPVCSNYMWACTMPILGVKEGGRICRAHLRRQKCKYKSCCNGWHAENRIGKLFLHPNHPQAASSLFIYINARLHAAFQTLTPTTSKFHPACLCAQSGCQNGMCVCAISISYVACAIVLVQLAYCIDNHI